jgi:hypothetical protein
MTDDLDPLTDRLLDDLLLESHSSDSPSARVHRARYRLRFAALQAGQTIRDVAPDPPAPGESLHALSDGTYNFATWLPQIVAWFDHIDELDLVTWTTSRHAAEELLSLHQAGKITRLNLYLSHFFRSRDPSTYAYLRQNLHPPNTFHAFPNHAKILLAANRATDHYLAIETSANLNTNPRYEQYTITHDRNLWQFHRDWLAQIRSLPPPRTREKHKKPQRAWHGYSVRRAGLNVSAYSQAKTDREMLLRLRPAQSQTPDRLEPIATKLAQLVTTNLNPLPADTLITHPPQGASWPNPHLAAAIARLTADILNRPYAALLARTDAKRHHHHMRALAQAPFHVPEPPQPRPTLAIVIDDAIISGATMRLSLQALLHASIPGWGFAYYAD